MPTGVNLNWSSVTFTATAITRVTNCSFDEGGNIIYFSGDANIYNVVSAVAVNAPTASITTGDVGNAFNAFTVGAIGSLVASLNDARGATGGGVTFTMNAVYHTTTGSGAHAAFASATLNFGAVSTDGVTNPLAISRF
jgi:hypothetical protein